MQMKIDLTFKELTQAVVDYAASKGAKLPVNSKVVFQCHGTDVQNVGGIAAITASIVLQDKLEETVPPTIPPIIQAPPVTIPAQPIIPAPLPTLTPLPA